MYSLFRDRFPFRNPQKGAKINNKKTRGKLSPDKDTWSLTNVKYTLSGLRMKLAWKAPTRIELKDNRLTEKDIGVLGKMAKQLNLADNDQTKVAELATKGYVECRPKGKPDRMQHIVVFERSGIVLREAVFNNNLGSKVCKAENKPFIAPKKAGINQVDVDLYMTALYALKVAIQTRVKKGVIGPGPVTFTRRELECKVFLEYELKDVVVRVPYRIPK